MKLIVTDLDGTLLSDEKKVSEYNIEILNRAVKEKEIELVVASGRDIYSIKNLTKDLKIIYPVHEGDSSYVKNLKYHSDWNWLMKVVEKIENIKDSHHGRFGIYISSNSCVIQSTNFKSDKPIANPSYYYDDVILNSKLESTYNAVVRFINFYNKQKEE